jgi:hypothetical protein
MIDLSFFYHNSLHPLQSHRYGARVAPSARKPSTELDEAALKAARQVYESETQGVIYCQDARLVENEQMCLASMSNAPRNTTGIARSFASNKRCCY